MTDHELNAKMLQVCKIRCSPPNDRASADAYPWAGIHAPGKISAKDPGAIYLYVNRKNEYVVWNPVGRWGQVHDFVIPTLRRREFSVLIHYGEAARSVNVQAFDFSCSVVLHTQEDAVSSRLFCEAALEAWEKLEIADGH